MKFLINFVAALFLVQAVYAQSDNAPDMPTWMASPIFFENFMRGEEKPRSYSSQGLVHVDAEKAMPGYVLYSSGDKINLIDMTGRVIHSWELPYQSIYAYLLPNGHIFVNAKKLPEEGDFPFAWNYIGGGMMLELDWEGDIVWQHHDPYHHHDGKKTPEGGVMYLAVEKLTPDNQKLIMDMYPQILEKTIWSDVLVELDSRGNRIWEWHFQDHVDMDNFNDLGEYVKDERFIRFDEISHANAFEIHNDRILISFRHISTVMMIDKDTSEILWTLEKDMLKFQHDPHLLDNGNVLIFDNGPYYSEDRIPYSRVIEFDPTTRQIVWQYGNRPPEQELYSSIMSGAHRLANGNTFITESLTGRMIQVTRDGEVVWEYINDSNGEKITIYKGIHYSDEKIFPILLGGISNTH